MRRRSLGLAERAGDPVKLLSYGERRQLELALALGTHPRVLFLDEPCAGLSPSERQRIFKMVRALPREITVVLIEHDMDVALGLADRVTVMNRGRVMTEGTPAEVQSDPQVRDSISAISSPIMSNPLLTVSDIHTYYGDSYVLQGVSLTLRTGQIAAILGRNGMGKTTLIRSVAGLTPPRSGDIVFRDRSLRRQPPYAIAQAGIAIVPQGRRIFRSLSVRENLMLPTSVLARSSRASNGKETERRWDLDAVLNEFPQLAERMNYMGSSLSGGEQQMLAIGRALMANPELILMDEPSEGLSPRLVLQVREIMRRLRTLGHAILLVEQNLELALSVADEVYVLSSGRFVFQGTPAALAQETAILDQHLGVAGAKMI